jgi:hypothetical protein
MKSLGTLSLPDSLEWTDRYSYGLVEQGMLRTLAGTLVLFSQPLSAGRPITLTAADSVCWLSQAQVDALVAMAQQAGETYTLSWDGESHSVRFAHHQGVPIEFEPLWPHFSTYTGQIRLIEV